MAKVFYIAFDDLRDKYKSQTKQRITSMCKAIGEYTQTQIGVQGMPNRSVRFEVVGRKAKVAKDNICQEFCLVSVVLLSIKLLVYILYPGSTLSS